MKSIDSEKTAKQLTAFIQSSFQKEGYTDALVGVSGGVDSAISLTLTVQALGASHVHPVLMPYGKLKGNAGGDVKRFLSFLTIPKANILTVDIKPAVDAYCSWDPSIDAARKGNVMARMRMVVLFDLSKKLNALVVGTENKTEHLLGYYTRFGDEASDIEPIRFLYKHQVYELARYLKVPDYILKKAPSAGLWEGQTDEGELGFTYKEADEVLFLMTEKKYSRKQLLQKGYSKRLLHRIQWWIDKGSFKARLPKVHCET